jgi:NAD(P)-dependent dehydrogenase (short-subunit alcohol dehydrogenase family)
MRPIEETTVLITGATDGLGRGVAEQLAADGATVHLHGRDPERLAATADAIRSATGNERLVTHLADLASLEEVRALAADVGRSTERLHVLINNAGIGTGKPDKPTRQESRDGYELRFAVNYLAGFLLTMQLLPLLRRSSPARIVNVASLGQAPLDFDDVMLEESYSGGRAYSQSKLAQITFGFELGERLLGEEITVNSLHPATYMPTKMVRAAGVEPISSLEEGVQATLRLIADPELEGVTGRYFNGTRPASPHPQAEDPEARRRLRELSDRLCGLER